MGSLKGALLWDFDGTLARRIPGAWSSCSIEVLDRHEPGHAISLEAIRPFFQKGFPWHAPSTAHPELCEPDAWWAHLGEVITHAYESVGIQPVRARELAARFRERYLDPRCWELFDDAIDALTAARGLGWRSIVLSNHVPELPVIVDALGLTALVDGLVNSAATGFEKPHPEAFRLARRAAGDLPLLWMIGDSYEADVAGAQEEGIPGVLVRRHDERAKLQASGLAEAVAMIEGITVTP